MWDFIYWLLVIALILLAGAGGVYATYVGVDIVRRVLEYLNEMREIRVTPEHVQNLGIHVTMHKPNHLKAMEKKFGFHVNFGKKDKPESEKH